MAKQTSVVHAHLVRARPRVVAALLRAFRDLDFAEELFQDASVRALASWPDRGMPDDTTAWLVSTGRNAGIDILRRRKRVSGERAEDVLERLAPEGNVAQELAARIDDEVFRDDVLRLMFMCCHKELAVPDQLALALRVIAGFSVAEVARAFVVSPSAMEQRLTRAKRRAAAVAADLETPSMAERAERVRAVSIMIYLLFNQGYAAANGDAHINLSLCEEAIRLARLLLELFPGQVEVMGLLALCLLQHSRHVARVGPDGSLVVLERQDRNLWKRDLIAEGAVLVQKALLKGQPGPMQIQAAIAAVHCASADAAQTDWREIDMLYAALEHVQPNAIVTLNRSVAIGKVRGPQAALEVLAPLEAALAGYLPYHAARAALLAEAGRRTEAIEAFERALSCSPSRPEAAHLHRRLAELKK